MNIAVADEADIVAHIRMTTPGLAALNLHEKAYTSRAFDMKP